MKLILNNKTNEVIKCDSFNRNLNIPASDIIFNISFSTNNIIDALSMNYLTQYIDTPITNYKLFTDEDELIFDSGFTNAKLSSFNENFYNDSYNANGSIYVIREDNQIVEEE